MIIYGTSGDINLAILYGTSETSDAFFVTSFWKQQTCDI